MAESDLEKRRAKIEIDAVRKGVDRVWREQDRAPLAQTRPGKEFLRLVHPRLTEAIERERSKLETGTRRDYELPLMAMAPDRLAFLTLQAVFYEFSRSETVLMGVPALGLSERIGQWCQADAWYEKAEEREQRLFKAIYKRNRNPWNAKSRTEKKVKAYREFDWSEKDAGIKLGANLLRHAMEQGILEVRPQKMDSTLITFSRKTLDHLDRFFTEAETFALPYYLPTAGPPRPWRNGKGGGYDDLPLDFVKNVDEDEESALECQLGDLTIPCLAVNAIQETPWRLHQRLFEVLHHAWTRKRAKPALGPLKRVKVPPPLPEEGTPPDDYHERRRARAIAEWQNKQVLVNKILMGSRLAIARRLSKEGEIYIPHQVDWRGRAYAVPQAVHPHADDPGRALLEFRDGKPLRERGAYWLSVHLANLYGGLSKRPFDERIRWVEDHREAILDSAERPVQGAQFWVKADKPWRFLFATFDYARYAQGGEGVDSRTPVAMDGTCNGLQHLSALGKDPQGALWTNLVPSPHPQDLYQEVAHRLRARIEGEAAQGMKAADAWVELINRELVKQAAMTTSYGVTQQGVADQLYKFILGNKRFLNAKKSSMYMAGRLLKAIGEVVVKGVEIRDWLRSVAGLFARKKRPLSWVTPTGFRVVQDYRNVDRRVQTVVGTFKKRERNPKANPNVVKHQNSIVANLIHSLDASHMMLTVTALHRQGLRHFGMAHDSYAVHACDVDLMNRVLREEFIRVHTEFTLAGLYEQLQRQAPDLELPEPPPCGSLDLGEVKKSEYFFS